jgi:ABC-2 type transport system ATP-binding protein
MNVALKTVNLTKEFRRGIGSKPIVSLRGLNLEVMEGEIFGYLGPNGAGKTTTFKILMGFIRPSRGKAWIFGKEISDPSSREGVGFLPEQPYFYDHLTAEEFLRMHAQLVGIPKGEIKDRVEELLRMVGLERFKSTRIRRFSRGMLQRIGIAQALVNDPKLVLLDEPMSGLDPIGRRQMRELILRLKSEGRTVIYSSHILSDVETICDRVAILVRGELLGVGALEELLGEGELDEMFAQKVELWGGEAA